MEKIPTSIGLIMDGNRRWARQHSLPSFEGHRAGYEKLKECIVWAREAGVRSVFVYAFSTENWKRSPEEIAKLLELMDWALKHEEALFKKEQVHITFVGQRERLPKTLQESMKRVEETTKDGIIRLFVGLSYGGRAEIVDTAKRIARMENSADITEADFAAQLWTCGMPDPELIIRTGGERRLSNFLLWQGAYAELYFSDTYWPDFSKEEFIKILNYFSTREQREGA
jgi:undecaprenyl diphosphate synthase